MTENKSQQKNPYILIVEDDESLRETLKFALEIEGYNVITAENGKIGIEQLSKHPEVNLILLDLMMPVMNGWQFLENINKDKRVTRIPIVIVTAFSDQAQDLKVKDIIKKPVDLDNLLLVVKKWVTGLTGNISGEMLESGQ